MTTPTDLFADLPSHLPDEFVQTLLGATNVHIKRIVSHGHASPDGFWYDQDQHEFVVLLKGATRLRFEDGEIVLKPGDSLSIPTHQPHRGEWTTPDEPKIWLAARYG